MEVAHIQSYACRLYEAQGSKVIPEAAQKAAAYERRGQNVDGQTWRSFHVLKS